MNPETRAWIEGVKKRCDPASIGPWRNYGSSSYKFRYIGTIHKRGQKPLAILFNPYGNAENDFEFIAHSRTDLPKAIQIIEDQAKEIERLKENLKYAGLACHEFSLSNQGYKCKKCGETIP